MGFPIDGSVLLLRSEALTITHRPRQKLNHAAHHRCLQAPPPEAWAPGSEGTPARLRAQPARRVRATRRAQLPWRRWCAHARRRERGREGASFSLRVAFPRRACAGLSFARGVTARTRPACALPGGVPASHAPRPCARTVRRCGRPWEHPGISAAERRSGGGGRSLPWPGDVRQATGELGAESRGHTGSGCGGARGSSSSGPELGSAGIRRCICIRSSPGLSTLETTAIRWAASGMSPSR